MRRACLWGVVFWQVLMVGVVTSEPGPTADLAPLLGGHLLVLALSLVVVLAKERLPAWPVVVGCYLMFVWDWDSVASEESALLLAACWMMNLAGAVPALAVRGPVGLWTPVLAAVTVPLVMVVVRPDFDGNLPGAVFVTALSIMVATRIGRSHVVDFARRVDAEEATAAADHLAARALRTASQQAAEDGRILHDTAINTLGALAGGGAAVSSPEIVRERCARDVAIVEALMETSELRAVQVRSLVDGLDQMGIAVRFTGITGEQLARRETSLPSHILDALARALAELVRNAAKHSGAPEVVVDVSAPSDKFVVRVSDSGVGFDASSMADASAGRGVAESVFGRLAGTGVTVDFDTVPGRGTRVALTWSRTAVAGDGRQEVVPPRGPAFSDVVTNLDRRATEMFTASLVGVGVVLAVSNHQGRVTPEYPMVGVVAAVCGLAWWVSSARPRWVPWMPPLLIAGAVVAFVLSGAAVDFGRSDVVLWQAICPVGPLLMLISLPQWRRWTVAALGGYGTGVVTTAFVAGPGLVGWSVLIAGAAGLGLVAGWLGFQRTVARLGGRALRAQRAARRARADTELRQAALASRRRWSAAGLSDALDTLRQVADGALDPTDEQVRRTCAAEEAHLRQLTLLDPGLVHMGEWFARALAEARTSGANLAVRTGATDVDERLASRAGELVLAAVAAVPPGERLTTTLFPSNDAVHLTFVGNHPHLSSEAHGWSVPPQAVLSVRTFGVQDLVEVALPPRRRPTPADEGAQR